MSSVFSSESVYSLYKSFLSLLLMWGRVGLQIEMMWILSLHTNLHIFTKKKHIGCKISELLTDATHAHTYVYFSSVLKTVSCRSRTAAPIYWWNISPMCRSGTQQLRTIKTYSQGRTHAHTRSLMHRDLLRCTNTGYKHLLKLL